MCQTNAMTRLELRLFEAGKYYFSGDCTAGFRFVCSRIHPLCRWVVPAPDKNLVSVSTNKEHT